MPPEKIPSDRLPPQSREAEQSVLGSMLRDNRVINDVVQILRTENFYSDAHQQIYQAMVGLNDKGHPVDLVVLAEELKQRGQIENVGGYKAMAELWEAAPTAANAEYYARIVRDRAMVRDLIHASTEILRDSYDQVVPADELLASAERKILEVAQKGMIGQTTTLYQALEDAYTRIDQRGQGDKMSIGGLPTGFLDLDELTAGLHDSEMIIVAARPSVGKCLAYDAEIVLADGRVATIEEIYHERQARLLTLGEDWKLRLTEPTAFVDDGIKPVFRVTTRLGRQIETTLSHPFRTLEGWKPLAELRPGDAIAVPRRIEVFGSETLRDCEVKLLAYFIGDGCLTRTNPEFTNNNPQIQGDFLAAIKEFGGVKVRKEDSGGMRATSFRVACDPDYLLPRRQEFGVRVAALLQQHGLQLNRVAEKVGVSPGLVGLWRKGETAPAPETFSLLCCVLGVEEQELVPDGLLAISRNVPNAVTRWLKGMGLWGKKAQEKTIPSTIFRLQRQQVALFLNRLFATDGWATVLGWGNPQIGYGTTSERLARQIQHLLLRFGIIASLRKRPIRYRETIRITWQLDITDQVALRTFATEVGIFGKETAVARVLAALEGRNHQTNADLIPRTIWLQLAQLKGQASWASVAEQIGLPRSTNIHVGTRCLSRKRLLQFAQALQSRELEALARSDVYWDTIESIEPVGEKQVYDLTIPETHNFVANDICVHNTAFALSLIRNMTVDGGHPVFFVSLEQSRIELAERLLCGQARVDSHKLRKGTLSADDMRKLIDAGDVLRTAKLFIDDNATQSMLRIAANARRLKQRHNLKLVVIDYLQLIEPDNRRDPRQEQVAQISRRIKALAKELQIPVVALAQVNRASEDRQDHRPRLADLRESGSLEQDSDTVMFLHRPERYEPGQHEGIVEVIIGKQRNGPVGEITLAFIKQYMRYENYAVGTPFES